MLLFLSMFHISKLEDVIGRCPRAEGYSLDS